MKKYLFFILFFAAQGAHAQFTLKSDPFLISCVGDTIKHYLEYDTVWVDTWVSSIDSVRWRLRLGEWDIDIREIDTIAPWPFYFVYTDTFFNLPLSWEWPYWDIEVYATATDGSSGSVSVFASIGGVPDECEIRRVGFTADRRRICAGECVNFADDSDRYPRHQRWYFEGGSPGYSEERNPKGICYDTPGLYAVRHAVANTVNSDSLAIDGYIEVLPRPVAGTPPTMLEGLWGDTLYLSACTAATNYRWSPPDGLSCTDCPDPFVVLGGQSGYTLLAWEDEACVEACVYELSVGKKEGRVYVPSAFSPNGDGANDVFRVFGVFYELRRLEIYDRWGTLVFEGSGPDAAWDGRCAGQWAQSGVYAYKIIYKDLGDMVEKVEAGTLTLVK